MDAYCEDYVRLKLELEERERKVREREELLKIRMEEERKEKILEAKRKQKEAEFLATPLLDIMEKEKEERKRLESDFTQEERKMFDEYHELEEMFVMPHVLSLF